MIDSHIDITVGTYNKIASEYHLVQTDERRKFKERSMNEFFSKLKGRKVLVPGCGNGIDSRYLALLGLEATSFDLSNRMIELAKKEDPKGRYAVMDIRRVLDLEESFDGIWASACLYHLKKDELAQTFKDFHRILNDNGIFYLSMKTGEGERFEEKPLPGYCGGKNAIEKLKGKRYYHYYHPDTLKEMLQLDYKIIKTQQISYSQGGIELWVKKELV